MNELSAPTRSFTRLCVAQMLLAGSAFAGHAYAQTVPPLPPLTVEGKMSKQDKNASKKAKTKSGPAALSSSPADQTALPSQTAREQVQSDLPYSTPAAVSTATRSDMVRFGQIDTGDVLRSMPGTYTRESPQNPGIAINIRGLEGSGRVNMMLDGVRQNFRFTGHEAQGFTYVDPALVAGIDVTRGVVSTSGGAGALVGMANVRTLDIDDVLMPGKTSGALSTLTYGTNGVGWQEMVAGAVTNGKVAMMGAISHREPNSYANGSGVKVPYTDEDLLSGLFKVNFALSSEQNLKFGAQFYENDYFANSYFQNLNRATYTMNYTYKPHANPLVDLAVNAYVNEVRMEYSHDADPSDGLGSAAGRVIDDTGKGIDISNTSRFALGGMRVTSTYGYEHFEDVVDAYNETNPSSGGGVNPSGKATVGGAFSQTTFSYGIFDAIAGLRYDTYELEGSFTAQAGNPTNIPAGEYQLNKSEGRLNPKLTLAAQLLPWLQPYISYGETFRAPTIYETMLGGSHPSGGTSFSPNPFLEPELQKGWEVGANIKKDRLFTPSDMVRIKAVYFDMNVENYITACGTQPNLYFCNIEGVSSVRGVELQAMYDRGDAFIGLNYTYSTTDLPSQQDGLGAHSYLPEHVTSATVGLRLFEQRLTVGTRITYNSESSVGEINAAGGYYTSSTMPGYLLTDLFTSYKASENLTVGASVTNLFDVDYTPALSTPYYASGTCFGGNADGCIDSGRGRTLLFSATTRF